MKALLFCVCALLLSNSCVQNTQHIGAWKADSKTTVTFEEKDCLSLTKTKSS